MGSLDAYLFFGNHKGGKAVRVIYSLDQACRELGINPTLATISKTLRYVTFNGSSCK